MSVSVGPSSKSYLYAIDGILNALEIMKLDNQMDSLVGKVSAEFIMKSWPMGNMGLLVAAVCLFVGKVFADWVKGLCYMVKITLGCPQGVGQSAVDHVS